jgi:DNA-binding transcriptional LysR family regulator
MKVAEVRVWEAFHSVAKLGNFSRAAKSLNVALPQLSKRVAKLESQMGVKLFQRSTRVVALTNEGRALLPQVTALLENWQAAESLFEGSGRPLSGKIRLTTNPFVAHRLLLPILKDFRRLHPEVDFDIDVSEGLVDLIESNTDLALRIMRDIEDSSLIYRKLAPNTMVACASPRYLKRHPIPIEKPSDLQEHEMLMLDLDRERFFGPSQLKLKDLSSRRKIECRDGWFLTQLALNDFGILIRSVWDVRDHLRRGELVQVLPDYPLGDFGHLYAVIPDKKFLAPRVRSFLDFLVERSSQLANGSSRSRNDCARKKVN